MNLSYLSVGLEQELNFRKGLSCYHLGLFFYIFTKILPGLHLTYKFLSSRSFLGCQFDNFNIYKLHRDTFFDNHLFLPPGAAKAEGPLGLASMQLPVFSWIGVLYNFVAASVHVCGRCVDDVAFAVLSDVLCALRAASCYRRLLRSRWILVGVLQRSFGWKSRISSHLLYLLFCVIWMENCLRFTDCKHCFIDEPFMNNTWKWAGHQRQSRFIT